MGAHVGVIIYMKNKYSAKNGTHQMWLHETLVFILMVITKKIKRIPCNVCNVILKDLKDDSRLYPNLSSDLIDVNDISFPD